MEKSIVEIKVKRTMGCPGVFGYDAEATVDDGTRTVYVYVNYYEGWGYLVSEESMYKYMAEGGAAPTSGVMEVKGNVKDAGGEEYQDVFELLVDIIERM